MIFNQCTQIIFDEAHKAKGFNEDEMSGQSGSKMGIAVVNLQRALREARVVYVSATIATDISELHYMERIGLWGNSRHFENWHVFSKFIEQR